MVESGRRYFARLPDYIGLSPVRRKTMPRLIAVIAILLLLGTPEAQAQNTSCPPPQYTVESAKERMLELAAQRAEGLGGFTGRLLVPGPPPRCRQLPADEDLQRVLDELIRFVALEAEPFLSRQFFMAVRVALRNSERSGFEVPLETLAYVVEEGPTLHVRDYALHTLESVADDPRVRMYVLRWARAPRGPDGWPRLPQLIARGIYTGSFENHEKLRADLERNPSLILNPQVQCWVENGDVPYHQPPGPSELCDRS